MVLACAIERYSPQLCSCATVSRSHSATKPISNYHEYKRSLALFDNLEEVQELTQALRKSALGTYSEHLNKYCTFNYGYQGKVLIPSHPLVNQVLGDVVIKYSHGWFALSEKEVSTGINGLEFQRNKDRFLGLTDPMDVGYPLAMARGPNGLSIEFQTRIPNMRTWYDGLEVLYGPFPGLTVAEHRQLVKEIDNIFRSNSAKSFQKPVQEISSLFYRTEEMHSNTKALDIQIFKATDWIHRLHKLPQVLKEKIQFLYDHVSEEHFYQAQRTLKELFDLYGIMFDFNGVNFGVNELTGMLSVFDFSDPPSKSRAPGSVYHMGSALGKVLPLEYRIKVSRNFLTLCDLFGLAQSRKQMEMLILRLILGGERAGLSLNYKDIIPGN